MLFYRILEKIKEPRLKFSQGSVTVLEIMANYEEARVKLTNTQLSKFKYPAKNKTGTTLRITKKSFKNGELFYEILLTTRQNIKIKNVFANNMLTDRKLNKPQLSEKFIQANFLAVLQVN